MPSRPAFATAPLRRLGSRSVAQFMREDWQRRPALLRGVFAPDEFALRPDDLAALAARDDVEARLVTAFGGRWRLRHGPIAPAALPRRRRDWTLLVQGVNLFDAAADRLLGRFRFLPDARLDDVMASFAVPGGGVGAHVDSYDVFLVQTWGRRRWRISRQRDQRLRSGVPLRLLADFRATQEWVLEPGDVLYLPPGVAHEGTAVDDCITCSVGFRSPSWRELVPAVLDVLAERWQPRGRYQDRARAAAAQPARLPPAMAAALQRAFDGRIDRSTATVALLIALSEPKPGVRFAPPGRAARAAFAAAARRHGVSLDPATRLLYAAGAAAINGVALPGAASVRLRRLADARALPAAACRAASAREQMLLADWYGAGWLHLDH